MKKMISMLFCLISLCAYGQLQGDFRCAQDGRIYFYLSNPTGYQIPVAWRVYNFSTNEQRQYQGVMYPGCTFVYGPNDNWIWVKGEIFAVTYANGKTAYWTCTKTDPALQNRHNVIFDSEWRAVSIVVPKCNGNAGSLCSCKVYKGYKHYGMNKYQGSCSNYAGGHRCGHDPSAHGLPE